MKQSAELKDYLSRILSADSSYMCVERNGIRYIYEPTGSDISPVSGTEQSAMLIGISARGIFYSLSDKYAGVGKDYFEELLKFESLYNGLLTEQMNKYSAKKPVGGRVSASVKLRLDEFRDLELGRAAVDMIFGCSEKPVDHSRYEPLFLRYLLLGSKFLDDVVYAEILENADELNFRMLSEELTYRHAAGLLLDDEVVTRVGLYGKLRATPFEKFKVIANGRKYYVPREELLGAIKYDEEFAGGLKFSDIRKIGFGKNTIYEK